jgi:hypothetical protein
MKILNSFFISFLICSLGAGVATVSGQQEC